MMIRNSTSNHRLSTHYIMNLFFALLMLGAAIGCCDKDECGGEDDGGGEDESMFTVIQELGDAPDVENNARDITANPPFTIMGEIRGNGDVDYYKFNGDATKTYVISVTGNRTLEAGGQRAIDGLIVFTPPRNGPVVICVSGGNPGPYVVTVFES